jgi:amino acid transporter
MSDAGDRAGERSLVRGVSRWQVVALIFNTILGAGILGLPSKAYAAAGIYSLLALALALLLVVGVALCLSELASRYETTGGPYIYVQQAFGERPAFLAGWLIYASRVFTAATHLSLLLTYSYALFPGLELPLWSSIAAVVLVIAFTGLTLRGAKQAAVANGFFGAVKVGGLAAIALLGLAAIDVNVFPVTGAIEADSFSGVILLFMFAMMGFESATIVAGEIKNPQRNLPFGILVGISGAAALYAALMVASIALVPNLAETERPIAEIAKALFGRGGEMFAAGGAVLMLLGSLAAGFFLAPRLLFALGSTSYLPRVMGAVHPRWRTPHVAILATGAIVIALALSGDFLTVLSIATSTRMLVYAACCAALLKLRRRDADRRPSFVVPGGPVIPILAAVLSILVLVQGAWAELPALAGIGLLGLLLTLRFRPASQD